MKVQSDFGNNNPVIRYISELQSGLPLLPGLQTKVDVINGNLPIVRFRYVQGGQCTGTLKMKEGKTCS